MKLLTRIAVLLTASYGLANDRPNVLMIWVDDLRPEIGCYGVDVVQTPNLDRLAERSVRFNRAYCNIPVCGASRASVMTGLRGTPTRFTSFDTRADREAPDALPLAEAFQAAGYHTVSIGKVSHVMQDHADAWDELSRPGSGMQYATPENLELLQPPDGSGRRGWPWEVAPVEDADLSDGKNAAAGCEAIARLAHGEEPFLVAVGFHKPHLPFVAPESYWALYPTESITLPPNFATRPAAPEVAFTKWGELRSYHGMPRRGPVGADVARRLIAGYRACVSYTDAQIGRLLNQLDASGVADDTIVVLLGDHGWNLGEHGMWCKHCCFETSMRTPLVVAAPMLEGFAPGETNAITEFIDIYPTLCEITGVAAPDQLAGASFVGALRDPEHEHRAAAIGRFGIGDTIRTDRFRYTQYPDSRGKARRMLYDHHADPGEDRNLADDPAYAAVVAELSAGLAEAAN